VEGYSTRGRAEPCTNGVLQSSKSIMVEPAQSYSFQDDGEVIEVSGRVGVEAESLVVHSTTTTLTVKKKDGTVIFSIAELFSTVDASKTAFEVRDGELSVTLHKLAKEKWPTLEASKVGRLVL